MSSVFKPLDLIAKFRFKEQYLITILVAHVLEDVRGSVNPRDFTLLDLQPLQLDLDHVRHGLSISGRSGPKLSM